MPLPNTELASDHAIPLSTATLARHYLSVCGKNAIFFYTPDSNQLYLLVVPHRSRLQREQPLYELKSKPRPVYYEKGYFWLHGSSAQTLAELCSFFPEIVSLLKKQHLITYYLNTCEPQIKFSCQGWLSPVSYSPPNPWCVVHNEVLMRQNAITPLSSEFSCFENYLKELSATLGCTLTASAQHRTHLYGGAAITDHYWQLEAKCWQELVETITGYKAAIEDYPSHNQCRP